MTIRAGFDRRSFGMLASGESVEAITLANAKGSRVEILTLGAAIHSVVVPDRHGTLGEVTVGFATLAETLAAKGYFGATVGRVANRIAHGRFILDGQAYQLATNNGPNSLHGGAEGFDRANWTVEETEEAPIAAVTLAHISPDGDEGYPGTLSVTVRYSLDDEDRLTADYRATTDRPTIVALSNHAYWNLAAFADPAGAMGHRLTVPAETFLPTGPTAIPTGEFRRVAGTAFDFRADAAIGERVREASDEQLRIGLGYDHNWVIARGPSGELRSVAVLSHPASGRVMAVRSNQPGLQFYSGNFLDGRLCERTGHLLRMGDAVALEPQAFPDTANQPAFGSIRLAPGETYRNTIEWRFSTGAAQAR